MAKKKAIAEVQLEDGATVVADITAVHDTLPSPIDPVEQHEEGCPKLSGGECACTPIPLIAASHIANPIVAPATFAEVATKVEEMVSAAVERTDIIAELIEADEATANMGAAPIVSDEPEPEPVFIGKSSYECEKLVVADTPSISIEEQLIAALGVNGQITIEPHGQFRVKPHGVMRFGHGKTLANAIYDLHHPGQLPSAIDGQQTHG